MKTPPDWRMWDWTCEKCGKVASCPVDIGVSALNALAVVGQHHQTISAECHTAYQSRWIEIYGVTTYGRKFIEPDGRGGIRLVVQ